MSARAAPAVLFALLLSGIGCFSRQYRENPRLALVGGDPIVQMKPASKFKNVFAPHFAPAERHTDAPDVLEKLVGLELGDPARAYPIGLLDRFEVVNDVANGIPLLVSRCALSGVAAVWDRRVAGRTLVFQNSGALWRDTLVVQDRETGTYWCAATGAALSGQLAGERLRPICAVLARAVDWARAHPDSLYLDMKKSTSVPLPLLLYRVSPMQGVAGMKSQDRRHQPKDQVFTVSEAGEAVAFTADEIEESAPVQIRVGTKPVTVEWDPDLRTPRVFGFGPERRERAVVPMYWFAVGRHFHTVRTLTTG